MLWQYIEENGWQFSYENPHTYNTVDLPALPEWDVNTYPYATITYFSKNNKYVLSVSTDNLTVDGTTINPVSEGVMVQDYQIESNLIGNWIKMNEPYQFESYDMTKYPLIWTNTDILNADGSVYMAASNPVPVS